MRKTVLLITFSAAIIAAVLCSCGTVKEEETTNGDESVSYAVDRSYPITDGNLITKVKIDDEDCVNVEYYDNDGNLVEVFVWDEEYQKAHTLMKYSGDKMVSKEELTPDGSHSLLTTYYYDDNGNASGSTVSEYEKGNIAKSTTYDKDGKITGRSESERDENNRLIKISKYDGNDTLLEYTQYEYKDEKNVNPYKLSVYNGDESLKSYTEFTYNDDDLCVKESHFDKDGKLSDYYAYEYYDSKTAKSFSRYDADGTLLSREEFEDTTN